MKRPAAMRGRASVATSPAEAARHHLALAEAAERQAFRGELEAKMVGDPALYLGLYGQWLPVAENKWDMDTAPVEEVDSVVRNQNVDQD